MDSKQFTILENQTATKIKKEPYPSVKKHLFYCEPNEGHSLYTAGKSIHESISILIGKGPQRSSSVKLIDGRIICIEYLTCQRLKCNILYFDEVTISRISLRALYTKIPYYDWIKHELNEELHLHKPDTIESFIKNKNKSDKLIGQLMRDTDQQIKEMELKGELGNEKLIGDLR